jgi:hypothetical protein
MRDSADSGDYGVTRRGRKRGKFDDDEAVFAKRNRHLPRLRAEDANDATDGLPEGDRWSTWDQTKNRVSNDGADRVHMPSCGVRPGRHRVAASWRPRRTASRCRLPGGL